MKYKFRNGTVVEGQDGQDKMLHRLYGNVFGRFLLKLLTARWISRLAGWYMNRGISRRMIGSFVKNNHIDLSQYEDVEYRNFNEFFSRKIRPESRPFDMDPTHLISPADSKVTVLPIDENTRFSLKNTPYTMASVLRNETLAAKYYGGYAMIFRLCVDDYHRYHYVADGTKEENTFLRGKLHTVNPIANDYYPIYKENSREYTTLHTEQFGDILIMEVGALLVGKIVNHHGKAEVKRGQEKGLFLYGGSTVVLFLEANKVQPDQDLLDNSAQGYETVVKVGEKVGTAL